MYPNIAGLRIRTPRDYASERCEIMLPHTTGLRSRGYRERLWEMSDFHSLD